MGKKKEKAKVKKKDSGQVKVEETDAPSRKDLVRKIEKLQTHNEALRARLERIAEIATSQMPGTAPSAQLTTPEPDPENS